VRLLVLALGLVALAASGCGESSSPEPCARSEEDGCLVVIQRIIGGRVYTEGSISYVHVTDQSGTVFETELHGPGIRKVLDASLDPGSYRLASYQRPCMGNCDSLDPATDRCSTDFEIRPGAQATVLIGVRPGEACTVVAEF